MTQDCCQQKRILDYNTFFHQSFSFSPRKKNIKFIFIEFLEVILINIHIINKAPLPVAFIFNIENKPVQGRTYNQFVDYWKELTKEAYEIATKHASKSAGGRKRFDDKKVFSNTLKVDDRFLVRSLYPLFFSYFIKRKFIYFTENAFLVVKIFTFL